MYTLSLVSGRWFFGSVPPHDTLPAAQGCNPSLMLTQHKRLQLGRVLGPCPLRGTQSASRTSSHADKTDELCDRSNESGMVKGQSRLFTILIKAQTFVQKTEQTHH